MEFALVFTLLTVLIVGMLQFGLILSEWLQVVHSAQEGARRAALREDPASVHDRVDASAAPLVPRRIDISPTGYQDPSATGEPVTVTVYYDAAVFAPLMEGILRASGTKELRASATQRVE